MKILDCTIRDGGYYTKWDFDSDLIFEYSKAMETLPVEYVEVGYRSTKMSGYLGEYFYTPIYALKELKKLMPSKKLAIILNEKDTRTEHLKDLLTPIKNYVSLIRIAVDPKNTKRAIGLAKSIKLMGFNVAFNVMYMSEWKHDSKFLDLLSELHDTLDYFYMVDSYGGILPNELKEIIALVKSKTNIPLGFHGHDNLHMGLINSLTAVDEGCKIVDCTITGIGRGAGNLKTELLLTYLDSQKKINVNFNQLSETVTSFEELKKNYNWGTSLSYMFSGAHSLPQKDVMNWVTKRSFSLNSIIQALHNKKENISDNIKMPTFNEKFSFKKAIIIGGGTNAKHHSSAVKEFIRQFSKDVCLIHSSARNASHYLDINVQQYFCLIGNEGYRLEKALNKSFQNDYIKCILPPYPRTMGTFVPEKVINITFELPKIDFTDLYKNSHFALALQTSIQLNCSEVFLVGFDGYRGNISKKELDLAFENNYLIEKFKNKSSTIVALTETEYKVEKHSIYTYIR